MKCVIGARVRVISSTEVAVPFWNATGIIVAVGSEAAMVAFDRLIANFTYPAATDYGKLYPNCYTLSNRVLVPIISNKPGGNT